VRKLKSETKDKSVWQPEVTKLLDLKKQLAEAEKAAAAAPKPTAAPTTVSVTSDDVASLMAAVAAQGDKVRKLKSETKDKAVIQPAVNELLELKKRLDAAQKSAPAPPTEAAGQPSPANSIAADLEAAVAAQVCVVFRVDEQSIFLCSCSI